MKKSFFSFSVVLGALALAPVSQAMLVSGPDIIAAPASVVDSSAAGGAFNTAQQAFDERQSVTLVAPLNVDGATDIPAGTVVDSHMIFLNKRDGLSGTLASTATWTFDGLILGVMSDVSGAAEAASNAILGALGTIYPGSFSNRGMEGGDSYLVALNQITVTMQVTQPGDWIRVVTASRPPSVPDAGATLGLLGLALTGLGVFARHKSR